MRRPAWVAGDWGNTDGSLKRADTNLEHADEASIGEVRRDLILRQVRKTKPGQSCVKSQGDVVEY